MHENSKRFKKTLCRNRSLLILLKTPSLARRTGMDTDRFCRVLLGNCFAASHKFRTGPSQCPCSDELSAILSIIIGKTPRQHSHSGRCSWFQSLFWSLILVDICVPLHVAGTATLYTSWDRVPFTHCHFLTEPDVFC